LQRFKADYLKAMAHPVRIRVLEVLRPGEIGVAEVQSQVDPDVANISQHLAVLRSIGVVAARKAGPSVLYSVRDPEVFSILDALREIFSHQLHSMQSMLAADDGSRPVPGAGAGSDADRDGPCGTGGAVPR
jgi:DNA-binding transcriptional ArsR family regulator